MIQSTLWIRAFDNMNRHQRRMHNQQPDPALQLPPRASGFGGRARNYNAAIALALVFLVGCANGVSSKPSQCALFVANIEDDKSEEGLDFSIERDHSIEAGIFAGPYERMKSISSGCRPAEIDAVLPADLVHPWDAPNHIDISSGRHRGAPWVQFVYPSIDNEYGPGLSSSIVFYDSQGTPSSTVQVSSYHAWEGAKVSSSRISGAELERCTQTIEFFSYKDNGDIDKELDTPVRTACEYSRESIP